MHMDETNGQRGPYLPETELPAGGAALAAGGAGAEGFGSGPDGFFSSGGNTFQIKESIFKKWTTTRSKKTWTAALGRCSRSLTTDSKTNKKQEDQRKQETREINYLQKVQLSVQEVQQELKTLV